MDEWAKFLTLLSSPFMAGTFACPPVSPMRIVWIGSLIIFGTHAVTQTPRADTDSRFDAHRLRLGTFRYSDSSDGAVVGESKIGVQRSEGGHEYVFSNFGEGAADQRWKAVIAPDFSPVSAELAFWDGVQARAIAMALSIGTLTRRSQLIPLIDGSIGRLSWR